MSNTVPLREASWALLLERVEVLADRCAEFEAAHGDAASTAVREAGERAAEVAAALAGHVPDALRPPGRVRA